MKTILLTGANGFIATEFVKRYKDKYKFIYLSHSGNNLSLDNLESSPELIVDIDIVLNLAGANIGAKRWSIKRKDELLASRILTTNRLVKLFNQYNKKAYFINASAIGIYDTDTMSSELTSIEYNRYDNFSMQLVKQWEQSALTYQGDVTITRFGVVLSSFGGAFLKMLQPFLFGVGGRLGSGTQYFPWICLYDLLSILDKLIEGRLLGIYNLVAPQLVTNSLLSQEISNVWNKPYFFHMPEFMVKLLFGQMGNELFLNSIKVESVRLNEIGYTFMYPTLNECLLAIKKGVV